MNAEQLKERYAGIRHEQNILLHSAIFFSALRGEADDAAVAELCLWILETGTPTYAFWEAQNAGRELERRCAVDALPRLKALRESQPHIGPLLDASIAALQSLADGTACVCDLNARRAAEIGPGMTVVSREEHPGESRNVNLCVCERCGKQWRITEEIYVRGGSGFYWEEA